ncbi:MAG: DNA repair protein RecN [Acidobacteriota bacterium]
MLKLLIINNLALVDHLQIEFGAGLNVLTGETGSGKSIIIDAVELLLGGRASQEAIRSGADRASVEGVFSATGNSPLLELLDEAGIDLNDGEIIIRREIGTTGRGRIFVNGHPSPAALLRSVQPHLLDLHGQGDQQSLALASVHLLLLDQFAEGIPQRALVEGIYRDIAEKLDDLERLSGSESARIQEMDVVHHQIAEIEAASIQPEEDAALEAELTLLANADRLARICGESYSRLYEEEHAVLASLGTLSRRMEELVLLDVRFQTHLDQLKNSRFTLEEIAFFLRDYISDIQVSPERLTVVEERLGLLERLKRKYGGNLANITQKLESLKHRAETLSSSEEAVASHIASLARLIDEHESAASTLSTARQSRAPEFQKQMVDELANVALEKSRFEIRFAEIDATALRARLERFALPAPSGGRLGNEVAQFFFSANPGEDLRPLNQVASGGELSRLMLVIKNVVAPTNFPRTLIFDEIDAGIGGRVADAVGLRLKRLAGTNQVLCVTHQAQIARYADTHFQISKEAADARTTTRATELNHNGRVEELARMLAGADVTPLARKHARELLRRD